ncbi:hypothetical protein ACFU44_29450 [Nocardia rhizosphaerihabitans]|uniref:hypothetical protein n=1 Tax=Nocardia rhizosphaerihabitans TaxID=1691570 RepID=UPI00366D2D36
MDTDRTTIPGTGVLHHFRTRAGTRFALLTESTGTRHLLTYAAGSDEPATDIALTPDEADQIAELLHSSSVRDRLARLEQRIAHLADPV